MNLPVLLAAAAVPLVIGFLWYSPFTFAKAWMKASDTSEEKVKTGNMFLIFGLTYIFSLMLATVLQMLVIHQANVPSIFMNDPGVGDKTTEVGHIIDLINTKYAGNFRTFKHGMLHGTITSIFFALPVFGIIALFERKGWRYFLIHIGFWTLSLMLMGGIICQFA